MADFGRCNILIVDDLPEKLLVYRTILDDLGQNLIMASSGQEALKQVLRHEFAVILLDVAMPGMDGFETAALIRSRPRSIHTPIIFVTAYADDVRAAEGYARGAVDYILSPVVPEILRAKIKVFVDLFLLREQTRQQAEQRIALAEERSRRAAAEEANRRLSFLAGAGAVLGQSLDSAVTARDIARLPVPVLADVAVLVLDRPGAAWNAIVARQAEGETTLQEDAAREDLPIELATGIEQTFGDWPRRSVPGRPSAIDPSSLVLPLHVQNRLHGVLGLTRLSGRPVFDPDEQTIAHDLAIRAAVALDNARLHEAVQRADRQKNDFLSMLAHELRNPLAPIRNAVNVIRLRGPEQQPDVLWASTVIERQIEHMVRLVDDLLDISRVTRGKIRLQMEPVEMKAVLGHAIESVRPMMEARHHHLDLHMPSDPIWVQGDRTRLVQIVTNLLSNAAKYTDEGGRIALTLAREGDEAICRVADDGVGIPADMLSAIFDLFTQVDRSLDRSEGGLGIGLTLVRQLVEMHGGSVSASSEGAGKGSEFLVRLPARTTEPAAISATNGAATHAQAPPARHRVLLVEDNVDAAESLAMLLRISGFEVRLACEGPEALRVAADFRPTVVVLDIGLPGMNGYEVARRLLAESGTRSTALVALTGYGQDEDRARSVEAGFHHHLVKPVDFETLRDLLAGIPALATL